MSIKLVANTQQDQVCCKKRVNFFINISSIQPLNSESANLYFNIEFITEKKALHYIFSNRNLVSNVTTAITGNKGNQMKVQCEIESYSPKGLPLIEPSTVNYGETYIFRPNHSPNQPIHDF